MESRFMESKFMEVIFVLNEIFDIMLIIQK